MKISIIGSGFAALAAIQQLRLLDPGRSLQIELIAPKPIFTYYPSLIWMPSGLRKRPDLEIPLQHFLDRLGIDFFHGEVTALEEGGRTVVTKQGHRTNDALLIASGGRYLGALPGINHTINPCSSITATERFRDALATMTTGRIAFGFAGNPQEPTAVRGGPMFEFLFGLHTQLQREKRRNRFQLSFFCPMAEPGQRLGPKAVTGLLAAMAKRDIKTHLGKKILGFEAKRIRTEGGDIPTDLTLFLPGMTGHPWYQKSGLPLSPGGFLQADAQCRVLKSNRVYVAGDAGSFPGPDWRAKQGHMAELQAKTAATNLFHELHGRTVSNTFRTELICIVDTLNTGILISRFPAFNLILPPLGSMHWIKRLLEFKSLYPYR
ncbi:MAG: NAD(P)/FAD-dependent oxidoreductase [Magnetococcus sp. DMHC-6]